jgi:hypothetical protein
VESIALDRQSDAASETYIKALSRLADKWGLTNDEMADLIGVGGRRTWSRWKDTPAKAVFNQDQLTRASLLIGCYKALNLLFSKPLADLWPKRANTGALFNGAAPIAVMRTGGIPAMLAVRQHLDGLRGGA